MTDRALRDAVVAQGRSFYERGLSPGTSGNISVRTHDGWLMTPTNTSLGRLDPARLSRLDGEGRYVEGDLPTKELGLHLAMYEERQGAQAIVHLHSTYAVAVACLEEADPDDVLPPLTPYFIMRAGRVALVPYDSPGDSALVEAVRARARECGALLLANHGPIVAGASLSAAASAIEEIEETAKLVILLKGFLVRRLTAEQMAKLNRHTS